MQLPLVLYRRDGESRERATDHPLYSLLHDAPNEEQTAAEWREVMQHHLDLPGARAAGVPPAYPLARSSSTIDHRGAGAA